VVLNHILAKLKLDLFNSCRSEWMSVLYSINPIIFTGENLCKNACSCISQPCNFVIIIGIPYI
jgi:hypothetical protein